MGILGLILVVVIGVIRKRIISPIIIYGLMLSFYPACIYLYYDLIGINSLPEIVPHFSNESVYDFYILSLMAIIGLLAAEVLFGRKFTYSQLTIGTEFKKISAKFFSLISFIIAFFMLFYVFYNKNYFIDSYIYQLIRSSGFDSTVVGVLSTYNSLEALFLMFLFYSFILNDNKINKSRYIVFALVFFLFIKIIIGSRLMLVPIILLWLYLGGGNVKINFKKKLLLASIFPIFIFFNIFRERESNVTFLEGVLGFSYEYIFASISAISSVDFVKNDSFPNSILMFLDGLIAVIPSFLLGGANFKYEIMTFTKWVDSIGGYLYISPVGGYYLPGQIYLATKNSFIVLLIFFFIGWLLAYSEKLMFTSGSAWKKVVGAQICCLAMVYGVRSELWIFEKVLIQQIFLFSFVVWMLWFNIYKYILLKR